MVIGILSILGIAALSALTAIIPLFVVLISIEMLTFVSIRFRARSHRLEYWLYSLATPLSTYVAAVAQLAIWQLRPRTDPIKWVIVAFIYMLGAHIAMFVVAMKAETPLRRSIWVNMYALSALVMYGLLAASYLSPSTFDFLEKSPHHVSTFLFGGPQK